MMADFFRFQSCTGPGVAVDLDTLDELWEGEKPGTMVLVRSGGDPIVVVHDFDKFMKDYLSHYDCRPSKKKPSTARTVKGASSEKIVVLKATRPSSPDAG